MDYNLNTLGTQNFEHVVQAIARSVVGPRLTTFGLGPDGGREATWNGDCPSLNNADNWNGYGVVQAKFCMLTGDAASNLKWLEKTISQELEDWADKKKNRQPKPEFVLFATNVRLSSGANGGKDKIAEFVRVKSSSVGLALLDSRVWDYDDLRTLLDNASDVRKRYAAFITPGDIIERLASDLEWHDKAFGSTLLIHAANTFLDENNLSLTQAGAVSDQAVTVASVVVDLPAATSSGTHRSYQFDHHKSPDPGIMAQLLYMFNQDSAAQDKSRGQRAVVIGGPGQGKSTVTQWLAQLYRAQFIKYTTTSANEDISKYLREVDLKAKEIELPPVGARRWPFRIVLTEFADYLNDADGGSILEFIASSISRSTSLQVTTTQMLKWLGEYPWVLLIDGLDEVPTTSNREEVLIAIRSFFVTATTLESDVAVVATTRPQGYNDEFPPDRYKEFNLLPLSKEHALNYATGLIAIRHGVGTTSSDKIFRRLENAFDEPTTARLMESPLQVTILAVLLEKLGHAPQQRWRLFSQYYKVITQREQEKGGELAELLQSYESDVDYLHRHVGYLLQSGGSGAGATSATLNNDEFKQIIVLRLRAQGHDDAEVQRLSDKFSTLVTDRLVFLTRLTSELVGFELRSLQEFMAAEKVLSLPEAEIIPQLRTLSFNAYWRNVALFIAGGIFSSRETLKAEVVLLCGDLNHDIPVNRTLKPGADLAIDLLRDGSASAQPGYQRGLAWAATEMLDAPMHERIHGLAGPSDPTTLQVMRSKARDDSPVSPSKRKNRVRLLAALATESKDQGDDKTFFFDLIQGAENSTVQLAAETAIDLQDSTLAEMIESRILLCNPIELVRHALISPHYRGWFSSSAEFAQVTPWLGTIQVLAGNGERSYYSVAVSWPDAEGAPRDFPFDLSHTPLFEGANQCWEWVAGTTGGQGSWSLLRAIAKFILDPKRETLSTALAIAAASKSDDIHLLRGVPWVLRACFENARIFSIRHTDDDFGRQLLHLSSAAIDGKLGDTETWLVAEARLKEGIVLTDAIQCIDDQTGRTWDNPLPRELAVSGAALSGLGLAARRVSSSSLDTAIRFVTALIEQVQSSCFGASRDFVMNAIDFYSRMIFEYHGSGRSKEDNAHLASFRGLLSQLDWSYVYGTVWPTWIDFEDTNTISNDDIGRLVSIGRRPMISHTPASFTALNIRALRENATDHEERWPLARLEILSSPMAATGVPSSDLPEDDGGPIAHSLWCAWRLIISTTDQILAGDMDQAIVWLCQKNEVSPSLAWLSDFISARPQEDSLAVGAYIIDLVFEGNPDAAEVLLNESLTVLRSAAMESALV